MLLKIILVSSILAIVAFTAYQMGYTVGRQNTIEEVNELNSRKE